MKTLSPNALGLTAGILGAVCMLIMGLLAMGGIYMGAFEVMKSFHLFFDATPVGVIAGIAESFVFSYILGFVFGWLYNKLSI